MTNPPISTEEWKAAGLPFEAWLRYAQMDKAQQQTLEAKFWARLKRQEGETKL